MQDLVAEERIILKKVAGSLKPADHLTKPKNAKEIGEIIRRWGGRLEVKEGPSRK